MRAALLLIVPLILAAAPPRLATFRADLTPRMGDPLIWVTPLTKIEDPLRAKGIILEAGGTRVVLCAIDWCGVGGPAYDILRKALARAAGTGNIALHTVHQHAAPYIAGDGYLRMRSLEELSARLGEAVRTADWQPFDSVATAETRVERVASARRILTGGKVTVRFSTGGRDPALAALPEGDIDPSLRTITFAYRGRVLARVHYYATHPQTFCCDGRASADFVGAAREAAEREQGVFQVYFTGAAGDVTVGKYNDGSAEARRGLETRLLAAMRAAAAAKPTYIPVGDLTWRTEPLVLPKTQRRAPPGTPDEAEAYRRAITAAFVQRQEPLKAALVEIGGIRAIHLPGEPMLEFQRYARELGAFAVAGYGDISPGYLCTDRAYEEGGYEPGASNTAPGAEEALKAVIGKLLKE